MEIINGERYYTIKELDDFWGKVIKKAQKDLRTELDELDNVKIQYAN